MRIFHTADWHLGHSLHGVPRDYEHGCFLEWLLDRLQERNADALLIAGDLFDSANPPSSALALFYRFIAEAGRRLPDLQVVAIAGNHDSPARLEAPSSILDALKARVVGSVRRHCGGGLDLDRLLVPLENRGGRVAAWCAAVPFLRPSDLELEADGREDGLVGGVRRLYREVLDAALERRRQGQALIAMGHCYMTGTRLSELSERRVLGGNQHALPGDLFPPLVSYAALGHLHLAQTVGGHRHIRYSGAPIPLALNERRYPHQVLQLDFAAGELVSVEPLPVPRFVEILRFPEAGAAEPAQAEAALEAHRFGPDLPPERYPYLEAAVRLDRPDPDLRRRIEAILEGKAARLLKLTTEYPGEGAGLTADAPSRRLGDLQPEGVFRARYRQRFGQEPPKALMAAFHALVEEVQGRET